MHSSATDRSYRLALVASTVAMLGWLTGCSDGDLSLAPEPERAESMSAGPVDPGLAGIYGLATRGVVNGSACQADVYDDFSFWVGDWNITPPGGTLPGTPSRITSELNGCVVMENYAGGWGRSLNVYDRRLNRWTQTYVDATGFTLRLRGGLEDGTMVMRDAERTSVVSGTSYKSVVGWIPQDDGTVRQKWFLSTDGGQTYSNIFDGVYQAVADGSAPPPAPGTCVNVFTAIRALDDLVGTWEVTDSDGSVLGTTTFTSQVGACLLVEDFQGQRGYASRRYLTFDRIVGHFFMVHADNTGTVFEMDGDLGSSGLALEGELAPTSRQGRPVRTTWSEVSPDQFQQVWEESPDGGTSWEPLTRITLSRIAS